MSTLSTVSAGLGIDLSCSSTPPGTVLSINIGHETPYTATGGIPTSESVSRTPNSLLSRHGTLLTAGATPQRNAAELKSLLGNSNARLKPNSTLLQIPGKPQHTTFLEQAKHRARVEVNIMLESNIFIQGGYMRGCVEVRIQRADIPVMLSDGKIRVIGFECNSKDRDRHAFYQCSAPLSTLTPTLDVLYGSHQDVEGFARANEGMHKFPFAMLLTLSGEHGHPKGVFNGHPGIAVRYIAMISVKVKDPISGKRSIAHFYRDCEIWPRLNPSVVLSSAPKPLLSTATRGPFMGDDGKIKLTASLHRLHWIAGQKCHVKICAVNDTAKTFKSSILTLYRSTITFKPHSSSEVFPSNVNHSVESNPYRPSTIHKQVAQSTLQMGRRGTGGYASAKGWWIGVGAGERLEFYHSILLPSDALSVTGGRILEIEYTVRVTLSAGTLSSDVQVSLPVRIINFLSVDPPPRFPLSSQEYSSQSQVEVANFDPTDSSITECVHDDIRLHQSSAEYCPDSSELGTTESRSEFKEESPMLPGLALGVFPLDDTSADNERSKTVDKYTTDGDELYDTDDGASSSDEFDDDNAELGNLSVYDDSDEVIQHAIYSARVETKYGMNATRFADLYYTSVQEGLRYAKFADQSSTAIRQENAEQDEDNHLVTIRPKQPHSTHFKNSHSSSVPFFGARPKYSGGQSSFASRVQQKLQEASKRATRNDDKEVNESYNVSPQDNSKSSTPEKRESVIPSNHRECSSAPPTESTLSGFTIDPVSIDHQSLYSMTTLPVTPPSTRSLTAASHPAVDPTQYAGVMSIERHIAKVAQGNDVRTNSVITRPPLTSDFGGSAISVKEKVEELEEKVKEERKRQSECQANHP